MFTRFQNPTVHAGRVCNAGCMQLAGGTNHNRGFCCAYCWQQQLVALGGWQRP